MTAVVFDMDGTLTDTEHIWDVVRRGLAEAEGLPWPDEATRAMMGMSTQEWSAYLADVVGLAGTPEDAAKKTIDGHGGRLRPRPRRAARRRRGRPADARARGRSGWPAPRRGC